MTPTISVIIRTYTPARWDTFAAAVRSVQVQRRAAHEIVVVVDHNPPLARRVRGAFPTALVVENGQVAGSSGAWNTGVAAASGEIVAFLDDDAEAAPDWLDELVAPFTDPTVVGVGGAIVPVWEAGRPRWFPVEFDWVVGCTYRGMPERLAEVRNLIGCNMSFRRDVFLTVGAFRNDMGHVGGRPIGCDETELCIRLRRMLPGTRLMHAPLARVAHHVPPSRSRWGYFWRRCYLEGQSKMLVARYAGRADGLSAERAYARRTLPSGVAVALRDLILRGDRAGALRASAIAAGLATATAGYLRGLVDSAHTARGGVGAPRERHA